MEDAANKKDVWDRVTALATILVPAAIALAGHFIAQGIKQAEISSEDKRASQAHSIAEANTKIAQASLINTMMKSLTSANPHERKLAVQAVLIALPEQGPVLVRTIAQYDEDESVQTAAKTSLERRVDVLIRNLFAEESRIRISSARDLIAGWRDDAEAVESLINFASENLNNSNGVFNTVVVLNEFSSEALLHNKSLLLDFIQQAKQTGPKTEKKVNALAKRLE